MNLGSLYIQFALTLLKFVLHAFLSLPYIRGTKCITKTRNFFTSELIWNEVLEFIFGAYTEILFALALYHNHLDWTNYTYYAPNISFIFFLIVALFLPVGLLIFLRKNYTKLHEDKYQEKFSQGYLGVG